MNVMVVIPAYNPVPKMVGLVRSLRELGFGVCVVDDGSTEGQAAFGAVRGLGATVLVHPENRGKGAALKTAFRYLLNSGYEGVIVTADADGQHTPRDIGRIARVVSENPDSLVLGVRDVAEMPARSRFGNSFTSWLVGVRFGIHVRDTQTGLRGISSAHLPDALAIVGERYEYEMSALLRARRNFSGIVQVPIETIYDEGNTTSHFSPMRDSLRILRLVLAKNI